jgi:hypothetical protein
MNLDKDHFSYLKQSYELVGGKIFQKNDFDLADLQSSISLFENNKNTPNNPVPIDVDVYAVLSGISFNDHFMKYISSIQKKILEAIDGKKSYFVKPFNLGVEYAVLKWPSDILHENTLDDAKKIINETEYTSFFLKIFGIQVHEDGCIVLKCIDEDRLIFKLRELLQVNVSNIPIKQSGWAHIPLGRILCPIGKDRMMHLKDVISKIDSELDYNLLIDSVHLVHETKWYMEQKKYLLTKKFHKRT